MDDDAFWSLAMLSPIQYENSRTKTAYGRDCINFNDDEDDIADTASTSFTILPPHHNTSHTLLVLNLHTNQNDGVLSDIASSIWDAGLILSAYLYGTDEGRKLCYDACFHKHASEMNGILELGSGMGIVGLSAAAAALSVHSERQSNDCSSAARVVLSDLNNKQILSNLRKNVNANLDAIVATSNKVDNEKKLLSITAEACDWMDVSASLTVGADISSNTKNNFPCASFNLILGSALVYFPEHAAACANTLFYYLTYGKSNEGSGANKDSLMERKAIILQLVDRCGFSTHFLPSCRKLGLGITSQDLDPELAKMVQQSKKNRTISVEDYRLYFITPPPTS